MPKIGDLCGCPSYPDARPLQEYDDDTQTVDPHPPRSQPSGLFPDRANGHTDLTDRRITLTNRYTRAAHCNARPSDGSTYLCNTNLHSAFSSGW